MSLLTLAELRAVVSTGLSDATLQAIIDREEAEIVRRRGAAGDGATPIVETIAGGARSVFLKRAAVSVTTVTENAHGTTPTTVTATGYALWAGRGQLTRLPTDAVWQDVVTVTYIPIDERSRRKQAIVEFVRIALERTAMKGESVAGEYSYQAPEWDSLRAVLYRGLGFLEV